MKSHFAPKNSAQGISWLKILVLPANHAQLTFSLRAFSQWVPYQKHATPKWVLPCPSRPRRKHKMRGELFLVGLDMREGVGKQSRQALNKIASIIGRGTTAFKEYRQLISTVLSRSSTHGHRRLLLALFSHTPWCRRLFDQKKVVILLFWDQFFG